MHYIIIVGLLWILYCIFHSALAAMPFKKRIQILFGKNYRYYRLFYNLFAVVTLLLILRYQFSFVSSVIFTPNLITKISGITFTVIGAFVMLFCITKYFKQESGFLWLYSQRTYKKAKLHIAGIHKYVRHPLYLGTFIFIWGLFVIFPSSVNLVSVCIITVYTLIAIHFEEKKLIVEFGNAYKKYKREVPMIFPKF